MTIRRNLLIVLLGLLAGSTHFVVTTTAANMPNSTPDFISSAAAFSLPVELGRKLQDEQNQTNQFPGFTNKTHIAFTEWLFAARHPGAPSFTNMGGAIDTAGILNMLMRNSSIVPISDMTGIMEFAGIWKKRSEVYAAPGYFAFRMYASAHATHPVSVRRTQEATRSRTA